MRSFLIIYDPNKDKKNSLKSILSYLDKTATEYNINQPNKYQTITQLTNTFVNKSTENSIILVIGNDETLSEVLNAIKSAKKYDIPLGFIPTTDSEFARSIGISSNPLEALQQFLSTSEAAYYNIGTYLEYNHGQRQYFINNLQIGSQAEIHNIYEPKIFRYIQSLKIRNIIKLMRVFYNQEEFDTTVRQGIQYSFLKQAYIVDITNNPNSNNLLNIHHTKDKSLFVLVLTHMSIFPYIVYRIMHKLKRDDKLPFVHKWKTSEIHVNVSSLETFYRDGISQPSAALDLLLQSTKYPFWINVNGIIKEK